MDEYIIKVIIEKGIEINIKSYGSSIEEVVDNLVQMETVKKIEEAVRKKDGAKWHLSGKVSLSKLREIRSQIKNEVLLRNILETNNMENV